MFGVGDVNADGKADVFASFQDDGTVDAILSLNGNPRDGVNIVGFSSHAVEAVGADINGDGIDDVVFGTFGTYRYLSVIFGRTNLGDEASLDFATDATIGTKGIKMTGVGSWLANAMATGDVNGDGIDDIAVNASIRATGRE